MEQIRNEGLVSFYLEKYKIRQYFDTADISFSIYRYRKGEFIRQPQESDNVFHFVVEGEVSIYFIREDGSKYSLANTNRFFILGDTELLDDSAPMAFAEAVSDVTSVGISLDKYRSQLSADPKFLYFIAQTLSKRLTSAASEEGTVISLTEKVLNHMRYHCQDRVLCGLEKTAFQLHCSERQLQRVLNSLAEEGYVEKNGKGSYRLLIVADSK